MRKQRNKSENSMLTDWHSSEVPSKDFADLIRVPTKHDFISKVIDDDIQAPEWGQYKLFKHHHNEAKMTQSITSSNSSTTTIRS